MKISIFDEAAVSEREYRLKLFDIGSRVVLALADEHGNKIDNTSLVAITPNMELVRCCNVTDHIGLPLVSCNMLRMFGE